MYVRFFELLVSIFIGVIAALAASWLGAPLWGAYLALIIVGIGVYG